MRYILTMLLLLTPVVAAAQQGVAVREPDQIVTTGEGLIQVAPDRAWFTVTAESRAGSAREAQQRNAAAMRPVQDRLRAAGVVADAVRTLAYDLQYEWDFVDGRRVGKGYVARNSIEVRVDAIERVGELLEIAVNSGATSVSGIRFDLKDRAQQEREALRLAVTDARAKADVIASAARRTIGRILRIQEQGATDSQSPVRAFAMREAQGDGAPPVAIGQIELRAQVSLTASLE